MSPAPARLAALTGRHRSTLRKRPALTGRRSPAGTGHARNTTTGTSIAIVASAVTLLLIALATLHGATSNVVMTLSTLAIEVGLLLPAERRLLGGRNRPLAPTVAADPDPRSDHRTPATR